MADTGLLVAKSGFPPPTILLNIDDADDFRGAVTENYVAQALTANDYDLYYWESNYSAEVDYVIVRENNVIPLEVKGGKHTQSRSLNVFISKYNPPYSIRISTKNFGLENKIKSVPLYSVFAI